MQLSCPKCGTRDVRVARRNGAGEYLRGLLGIYPMRCRHCKTRWETSAWENSAWKYARCPKCYRQELSTWSEQYYHPPFWTRFHLRIGATPYRCAACRCNFTSFKKCKERFSWRHKDRAANAPMAAPVAAQGKEEFVGSEALPNGIILQSEAGKVTTESDSVQREARTDQVAASQAITSQAPGSQTPK